MIAFCWMLKCEETYYYFFFRQINTGCDITSLVEVIRGES